MSDVALRDNAGKPELSYLLDLPRALEALVLVFEQGAIKYERGNWKKGGKPDTEYVNSALRHLFALAQSDFDSDTGCMHAAHVMWNMAALIELNRTYRPIFDDDFNQAAFLEKYAK